MNRKQFIVLIAVLVGLALAGAGVMWWQKSAWRTNNGAVGERLLPGLVVSEVEKIRVVEAGESVTMNRVEGKWQVAERNGYPANLDRIADFLAKANKFWPSVGRIDNPYGDRNLICICPPMEAYAEA